MNGHVVTILVDSPPILTFKIHENVIQIVLNEEGEDPIFDATSFNHLTQNSYKAIINCNDLFIIDRFIDFIKASVG